uniref:AIG1-type G domain-containing protein n=1 Tax=Amphimedon queenslandica TaxID=400682 RepID=A0A1X7UI58_AMPQE
METEAPISHTILLIGETGSGKTSFLNLLCNYGIVQELGIDVGVQHFHPFNEIKLENATSDKMQSKTSDALKYTVSLGDTNLEIIDTPGLGDSRGIEQDINRLEMIIQCLKNEESIHCVCLVINGRATRISATLNYALSELTSILPKSSINNITVVFTNTTGVLNLSFELGAIKRAKDTMSKELLTKLLRDEFEKTAPTLNEFLRHVTSLDFIQTKDFMRSYEKKKAIEAELRAVYTVTCSDEKEKIKVELHNSIEELKTLSICSNYNTILRNRGILITQQLEAEDNEETIKELQTKRKEIKEQLIQIQSKH